MGVKKLWSEGAGCPLLNNIPKNTPRHLTGGGIFWYSMYVNKMTRGGVVKLVITPACQAGDRGFKPRRSRLLLPIAAPRVVAQGLARSVRDREVGSSNLPNPIIAL